MAKLTSKENIQKRLLEGFDREYHDSLYRQIQYAFGEPWRQGAVSGTGTNFVFPDYENFTVKYQEIGRSKRIFQSAFVTLSGTMMLAPEPEFTKVPKLVAEIRKQIFLSRFQGENADYAPWQDEFDKAYLDGTQVGVGFLHWYLKTNAKSGEQTVCCCHVPAVNVIWDRHENSPDRARWMVFVKSLPVDVAELRFGKKAVAGHISRQSSPNSTGFDVVRVFEYFDMGYGGGSPTMAVILGDISGEPIEIKKNVFGCIPESHYTHIQLPLSRPIGMVPLQMPAQEMLNQIDRALRRTVRQVGFDIYDPAQVEEEDMRRVESGQQTRVRAKGTRVQGQPEPVTRIQGGEASQTLLTVRALADRELNAMGSVTDSDRNILAENNRTATEQQLLARANETQKGWPKRQLLRFLITSVEKFVLLAKQYDRDPLDVDVFDNNVLANNPDEPGTWLSSVFHEKAGIVIDTQALEEKDVYQERMEKQSTLSALWPLVQSGVISVQKFAEEALKNAGYQEVQDWMGAMSQMSAQGAVQPGMASPVAI